MYLMPQLWGSRLYVIYICNVEFQCDTQFLMLFKVTHWIKYLHSSIFMQLSPLNKFLQTHISWIHHCCCGPRGKRNTSTSLSVKNTRTIWFKIIVHVTANLCNHLVEIWENEEAWLKSMFYYFGEYFFWDVPDLAVHSEVSFSGSSLPN